MNIKSKSKASESALTLLSSVFPLAFIVTFNNSSFSASHFAVDLLTLII
ncbi:hypothetical protein SHDE107825_12715 [Shewanella denitrificans]